MFHTVTAKIFQHNEYFWHSCHWFWCCHCVLC